MLKIGNPNVVVAADCKSVWHSEQAIAPGREKSPRRAIKAHDRPISPMEDPNVVFRVHTDTRDLAKGKVLRELWPVMHHFVGSIRVRRKQTQGCPKGHH